MILYQGEILESSYQNVFLERLEQDINKTLEFQTLSSQCVLNALLSLGKRMKNGDFDEEIKLLDIENSETYMETFIDLLKEDSLQKK